MEREQSVETSTLKTLYQNNSHVYNAIGSLAVGTGIVGLWFLAEKEEDQGLIEWIKKNPKKAAAIFILATGGTLAAFEWDTCKNYLWKKPIPDAKSRQEEIAALREQINLASQKDGQQGLLPLQERLVTLENQNRLMDFYEQWETHKEDTSTDQATLSATLEINQAARNDVDVIVPATLSQTDLFSLLGKINGKCTTSFNLSDGQTTTPTKFHMSAEQFRELSHLFNIQQP